MSTYVLHILDCGMQSDFRFREYCAPYAENKAENRTIIALMRKNEVFNVSVHNHRLQLTCS